MKEKGGNTNLPGHSTRGALQAGFSEQGDPDEKVDLRGYPSYPASEDIYNKYHEEENIDPEDISKIKEPNENDKVETSNEKDFNDDVSGGDLDIPGSEPDNDQENTGNEDEENNYYSLGGDDHNDLEENKGE